MSHVNCGKAGAAASYEAIGFFGVVSGTVKNLNVQIDKFYNTYSEYNIAMGGFGRHSGKQGGDRPLLCDRTGLCSV